MEAQKHDFGEELKSEKLQKILTACEQDLLRMACLEEVKQDVKISGIYSLLLQLCYGRNVWKAIQKISLLRLQSYFDMPAEVKQ